MYKLEDVTSKEKLISFCLTDCGPSDSCNPDDSCGPDDDDKKKQKKNKK